MLFPGLAGRRILLVDDELLIAMLLEDALEEQGCVVVGPFSRLQPALEAAQGAALDGALLDVNLMGERVFPAAEALACRAVPFLLLSGYGDKAVPVNRPHWPVLGKPFKVDQVLLKLDCLIGARGTLD